MKNKKFYFVYLITNRNKTVLYLGMTNNIKRRLTEHIDPKISGFSNRYKCRYLVYYEKHEYVNRAIFREKEIKKWNRKKKEQLINQFNPDWKTLNHLINTVDDVYL